MKRKASRRLHAAAYPWDLLELSDMAMEMCELDSRIGTRRKKEACKIGVKTFFDVVRMRTKGGVVTPSDSIADAFRMSTSVCQSVTASWTDFMYPCYEGVAKADMALQAHLKKD